MLNIRLLGPPVVSLGKGEVHFPARKTRDLLCYLLVNRSRRVAREVLAAQLWGEVPEASAQHALRNELWRLRNCIEPAPRRGSHLLVEEGSVRFNVDGEYWLDTEHFEQAVNAGRDGRNPAEAVEFLTHAVDLYRGDFMEGSYDEWCLIEQERLKHLLRVALSSMMNSYSVQHRYADAISCAERLLALDPLLESVHRRLMKCHYLSGDRPAALRQFEHCKTLLMRELQVAPMEQTIALERRIRFQAVPQLRRWKWLEQTVAQASPDDAVPSTSAALQLLGNAYEHLRRSEDELLVVMEDLRGHRCVAPNPPPE